MKRILLFATLLALCRASAAQLPAGQWAGILTQTGGRDTFSYALQLQAAGAEITGTAHSENPRGGKAVFSVRGSWDGTDLLLQEWKQEEPAQPRWCLKYLKLRIGADASGKSTLHGDWQAEGCRPGTVLLAAVAAGPPTAEQIAKWGRWTGHLDQADREYGFFYQLDLRPDGTGQSQIVSEASGGKATHDLEWLWDSSRQVLIILERRVLEKTDANWPWCIKQAELKWEALPNRQVISGPWSGFIEGYTLKEGACASGKVYLEKPIVPLQTQREVADRSTAYEKEHGRKLKVDRVVQVSSPKLRIKVWDNGTVYGDIVTVFLNGRQLVRKFRVSKHKWSIPVTLTEAENLLIIHAEDLGAITPNTVAVSIDDGSKEEVLVISSDLRVSGGILIQPFTYKADK